MNAKKIVIFGTGDFARIAHYYLEHDSPHEVVAHALSSELITERTFLDVPVVPFEQITELYPPARFSLFIGVAYSKVNQNRRDVFASAKQLGYDVASYVCTKATTWPDLDIGEGTFIFENNVVQPYVKIGSNTVLWSGNHIGHDSILGDHIFIASHVVISGNCRVGDNTFIGVNATVRDGITIGRSCVIGAGALVMKNVADGAVLKATATEPAAIRSSDLRKI
jgi:sugar O-acyltransferase (sialic acid O-acetyltransferase NeuD family)